MNYSYSDGNESGGFEIQRNPVKGFNKNMGGLGIIPVIVAASVATGKVNAAKKVITTIGSFFRKKTKTPAQSAVRKGPSGRETFYNGSWHTNQEWHWALVVDDINANMESRSLENSIAYMKNFFNSRSLPILPAYEPHIRELYSPMLAAQRELDNALAELEQAKRTVAIEEKIVITETQKKDIELAAAQTTAAAAAKKEAEKIVVESGLKITNLTPSAEPLMAGMLNKENITKVAMIAIPLIIVGMLFGGTSRAPISNPRRRR